MHIQGVLASLLRLQKGARSSEPQASAMCMKKRHIACVQNVEEEEDEASKLCLLDLPELVLEEILCRLDPQSLYRMATTCKQLWELCGGDHLWERLLQEKWGKVIGEVARKEWQRGNLSCRALMHGGNTLMIENRVRKALVWPFFRVWPFVGIKNKISEKLHEALFSDSVMACYGALETGALSFPAQVYNREHGHVGFLLSCYDAELSYDRKSNTFKARYPPHGSRTVVTEEGVQWNRLRAPPIPTQAHELHESDCLDVLRPGDHVEVQWRRNKDFPYGWWYGIVGHSDTCTPESRRCSCHLDDTVWLEFNQYAAGSRWRRAAVNRKTHREEGNETEGFYAGIRKLQHKGEISVWRQLWPTETLD
eukprot:c20608_g1_i1 orf=298-1392(-)